MWQMNERQLRREERLEQLRKNRIGRAGSVLETVTNHSATSSAAPQRSMTFRPSDLMADMFAEPAKENSAGLVERSASQLSGTSNTLSAGPPAAPGAKRSTDSTSQLINITAFVEAAPKPKKAGPPVAPKPAAALRGDSALITAACSRPAASSTTPVPQEPVAELLVTQPAPAVVVAAPSSMAEDAPEPAAAHPEPSTSLLACKVLSASLGSVVPAPSPGRSLDDGCVLGVAPLKPQRGFKRTGTRVASSVGDDDDDRTSHKSVKLDSLGTPRESLAARSVSYCTAREVAAAPVPPGKLGSSLTRDMSRSVDQLLSVSRAGYARLVNTPATPPATPQRPAAATPVMLSPSRRSVLEQTVHATRLPVERELERHVKVGWLAVRPRLIYE